MSAKPKIRMDGEPSISRHVCDPVTTKVQTWAHLNIQRINQINKNLKDFTKVFQPRADKIRQRMENDFQWMIKIEEQNEGFNN